MTSMTATCSPARRPHRGVLATLFSHIELMRQRRTLNTLDDRALEDLGLTRDQAEAEAKRPVWDAPECWFR